MPLPRGAVTDRGAWTFGAQDGPMRFAQVRALDRWADGSARWVLVDAQADLDGRTIQEFALDYDPSSNAAPPAPAIAITQSASTRSSSIPAQHDFSFAHTDACRSTRSRLMVNRRFLARAGASPSSTRRRGPRRPNPLGRSGRTADR